ncbi:MAG: hypothetical protein ACLQG5_02910 [Methanobacterium sp.]
MLIRSLQKIKLQPNNVNNDCNRKCFYHNPSMQKVTNALSNTNQNVKQLVIRL